MQTVGSQLTRIEDSLEKIQNPSKSKGKEKVVEEKPVVLQTTLIKPTVEPPKDWKMGKDNKDLLEALYSKLNKLSLHQDKQLLPISKNLVPIKHTARLSQKNYQTS